MIQEELVTTFKENKEIDGGSKTNYSKQIRTANSHKNKCTLSAALKEMEVGDICSCYVLNTNVAQNYPSEKPDHNKLLIYFWRKSVLTKWTVLSCELLNKKAGVGHITKCSDENCCV